MRTSRESQLRRLLAVYNRRYAGLLWPILTVMVVLAILSYVENSLLAGVSQAFADPASLRGELTDQVASWVGVGLPIAAVTLFGSARVMRALLSYFQRILDGRLAIRTIDDVEQEVLQNLLRKDDAFFGEHPVAEIMERLAKDLQRGMGRRQHAVQIAGSSMLIAGNLIFFLERDWRLAMVATLACIVGTLVSQRLLDPVKKMDAEYMGQNDRVKANFAEFLEIVPEVQVGGLSDAVAEKLDRAQRGRHGVFVRFTKLGALMSAVDILNALAALIAMLFAVQYIRGAGAESEAAALVPVVVLAVPRLFSQSARIVRSRLQLQLATTSVERLAEYESTGWELPANGEPSPIPTEPVVIDMCTFRYPGPDGQPQGGVSDVDMVCEPGRWTAIVGAAGSGKSTLVQLLLGRLPPQQGHVRYGSDDLKDLKVDKRTRIFSLMPQKPVLLDLSIAQNISFGRADEARLSDEDWEILRSSGLGAICLTKALDERAGETGAPLPRSLAELRDAARAHVTRRTGIELSPFEDGALDPSFWVLEALVAARVDRAALLERLEEPSTHRVLSALTTTALGAELMSRAERLLDDSRGLLTLESFEDFSKLAPRRVSRAVWALRRDALGSLNPGPRGNTQKRLLAVALLSTLGELGDIVSVDDLPTPEPHVALSRLTDGVSKRPQVGDLVAHLSWRENILFACARTANHRSSQAVEEALLEYLIRDADLSRHLMEVGLGYRVGRMGARLSGGQGQLVALCRTLFRSTPVIVLDEPTSALDPRGRDRVAQFLHERKQDRVIITISHDPELMRRADDILVLEAGRVVASGTFEELSASLPRFRSVIGLEGSA